jgi:hypothetical protein
MQVLVWNESVYLVHETNKKPSVHTFRRLKEKVEDIVRPWEVQYHIDELHKVRTVKELVAFAQEYDEYNMGMFLVTVQRLDAPMRWDCLG